MRIDSHHHLWDFSPEQYEWIPPESSLAQDYVGSDIAAVSEASGIDKTVVVQARQNLDETQALLDIAENSDVVAAVVGWLPLADPAIGGMLDQWADEKLLRSLRHVIQGEPDGFMDGEAFNAGVAELKLRNFVYDILILGRQLKESIRFVDRHPEQPFVLDHVAKPTIQADSFDRVWETDIRELAKRENVTCKVSGMATEVRDAEWSVETLRPYFDVVLEAFGPQRLMFGTDWPVCRLKVEHGDWVSMAETLVEPLSDAEKTAFWSETAEKAYGLSKI